MSEFSAVPRYLSPIPDSVDLTEAHRAAGSLGVQLLPQGVQVASLLEAKNEAGTPLYPEVVVQMGRRATKTTSINATLLGRCFSIPGYRIISTAQSGTLAQQFLAEVGQQLEMAYPDEATRPFRFYKSNGAIRIQWDNGSVWRAVKPQASAFRGSAADVILFDEAGEYDPKTSEDLLTGALPVLATRPNAQLIVTGTPPRTREGLLWQYLQAGRKGTEDLGILDYSMAPTEDATDEALWWRVYPGLSSGLVSIKFLRKSLETQGLLGFSREYLCLDPVAASVAAVDPEDWAATSTEEFPEIPPGFSLAFDVAPDGSAAALALAFYSEDGRPHVQMVDYRAGSNWLPGVIARWLTEHKGITVVYDAVGANVAVAQALQAKRGLPLSALHPLTMKDVAAGVSILTSAVSDRFLVHEQDRDLDAAVEGASFRYSGDSRLFGRRTSQHDVSSLVAASNALFDAAGKRKRGNRTPRKAVLL